MVCREEKKEGKGRRGEGMKEERGGDGGREGRGGGREEREGRGAKRGEEKRWRRVSGSDFNFQSRFCLQFEIISLDYSFYK